MYKYYDTPYGCMGYVPWLNKYQLFNNDTDYIEFIS